MNAEEMGERVCVAWASAFREQLEAQLSDSLVEAIVPQLLPGCALYIAKEIQRRAQQQPRIVLNVFFAKGDIK